jgi:hypothetical protein
MTPLSLARIQMRHATGVAWSEELVDWAVSELVDGLDTPNLRILAGLSFPHCRSEVEQYFAWVMDDLGYPLLGREEAVRNYVRLVAEAILAGTLPPLEGFNEVYAIAAREDFPSYLGEWVDLGFEIERLWDLEPGVDSEPEPALDQVIELARRFLAGSGGPTGASPDEAASQ